MPRHRGSSGQPFKKADARLDESTGVIKRLNSSKKDTKGTVVVPSGLQPPRAVQNSNMLKPQLLFRCPPDNHATTAFKPLLRSKPHSIEPFEESLRPIISEAGFQEYDISFYLSMRDCSSLMKDLINNHFRYKHPYGIEITQSQYPPFVYSKLEPIAYLSFESTKATFVDTLDVVREMLSVLKSAQEIAIDLEHHDAHSYVGLVSLMQISTRERDWVVDTLQPWREELQILNEVFADPKILKVKLLSSFEDLSNTFDRSFMEPPWT